MNRTLALATFALVAALASACSSNGPSSNPRSDADAATLPPPIDDSPSPSPSSPVPDAGEALVTTVTAEGLSFTPQSGGGRRAWSTRSTNEPPDVLDIVLTDFPGACKSGIADKSHVVTLYARAVAQAGVYPIKDTVILGGDGVTGQFSMLDATVLDRSAWPEDVRPECGYDLMTGTRWTSGTVTITRLDDAVVEGSLEATDAEGHTAKASFKLPLCLSRSPKTIGCGT